VARNTAQQGAQFERDIIHYLTGCDCETTRQTPVHIGWRGYGYDCMRSAASKGALDVIAIGSVDTTDEWNRMYDIRPSLLFIQAKRNKPALSPADRMRVQNLALRGGAVPLLAYSAKDPDTGRVYPHFRILTGPGPNDWAPWAPGKDDA